MFCDGMNMRKLAIEQYRRGLEEEPSFGRGWFRFGQDLEIYAKDYPQALQCCQKAHVYRMQDKDTAMHMYSLSDKLSKRDLDWSWKLKDTLKPPKNCRLSSNRIKQQHQHNPRGDTNHGDNLGT